MLAIVDAELASNVVCIDRAVIDLFPVGAQGDEAIRAVTEELRAVLGGRGAQVQLHAADQAMFERLSRAVRH